MRPHEPDWWPPHLTGRPAPDVTHPLVLAALLVAWLALLAMAVALGWWLA